MEHHSTPSPSSLAALLNPVHSPPPTHQQHILTLQQQQQQQQPYQQQYQYQQQQQQQQRQQQQHQLLFRKSISNRSLQNNPPKPYSSERPTSTLLFIDPTQHKPMSTIVANKLSTIEQNEQQQQHAFKQASTHPLLSRPSTTHTISSIPSTNASLPSPSPSSSITIETPLEESIFGIAPFNDFTHTIAQFIWEHSRQYWERGEGHLVEVEAKLGTIRDKRNSSERMEYPIATESPILETRDTKFETDMAPSHHANLNRLLNQRVTETNSPGYHGAKVDYLHIKEVDEFHQNKVRVSRDWSGQTHLPPRSIIKEKLAHLDIHCPGRPFDFRISVNVEHPVPIPPEYSHPSYKRVKDRLSYSHQICQIDLTQVKSSDQVALFPTSLQKEANSSSSTHEVEVEFKDSSQLLRAASIWASERDEVDDRQSPHGDEGGGYEEGEMGAAFRQQTRSQQLDAQEYLLMVEVMLNNVRMLIRNS
ncbi:hypothetical protein PCANC_01240 [Puccinia coronata f. sp. avenae]|uniref:mRNA-capping enzyme subunit beta n=1 Tax=Puccinia coronata f. sp. avenae TaxID=200324 RepID=A0A2N5T2X5_9BASI|nr:hypothetical protein PCASD_17216 [Puccinia coronata f. sp. avenae]PLW56928.1 hypothetical protein PCANC_01240 [Puccinia coronata f. sp. avenae]